MTDTPTPEETAPEGVDPHVPAAPRIWNHWLGGKDNYAADRRVGDQMAELYPSIVRLARADREFLGRAVRYLVAEEGVRQFLDIGTGLPTAGNTHQIAQELAPESRIVYVDNDPLVLAHARALLTSTPEGATAYIDADLHDPERILAEAARTLDLSRPFAVLLLGVLIYIDDTATAYSIVRTLKDALPPGGHLVIAHSTSEVHGAATEEVVRLRNERVKPPMTLRSGAEIARFFDGLDLLEPGVVPCNRWRPHPAGAHGEDVDEFAGVARKPWPGRAADRQASGPSGEQAAG
ncbi:SAM-dependent methyltransferase [Actinomadura nitritigenes]|uniref:SAM-dependent methyltransferase n=1 Tax=Actinomadura nitritigenes TaxID=134602 RepID=UPI0036C3947A